MRPLNKLLSIALLAFCAAFPWVAQALPGTTASLIGNYTTDNVPSFTVGFTDQFGNTNYPGTVTFNDTTSGQVVLTPPATGGGTLTMPAGSTTLAGLGTAQTFTGVQTFSGGISTAGSTFASGLSTNPPAQTELLNASVLAYNTVPGVTLLAGNAARTIFPSDLNIEAIGGNAATCTGLKVLCSPSGTLLGTFAVAQLTSGVPSNAYSASVTPGAAMVQGCAVGDSILVSAYGGLCATSTGFKTQIQYSVQ